MITLVDGDIDAVQEIQETMSVQVSVVAQGKIAGFTVQIDSPALTPRFSGAIGLSETLDLVNPGSMTEVLQDEMSMSDAQNNYLTAHFNYQVSNLTLLKLTGQLEKLTK